MSQDLLAAIILMAVIGLLDFKAFIHSWKAQWNDGAIALITFLATFYFAPHLNKGILVGVVLSMVVFLYKSMRPVVARIRSAGLGFSMSGVKGQVIAVMERTRLLDKIGMDYLFADTDDAVKAIIKKIHNGNELSYRKVVAKIALLLNTCPPRRLSDVTANRLPPFGRPAATALRR